MSDDLDALVSQVEALHLEDDSALVLTVPGNARRSSVGYVKEHLESLFRDRKVVVLDGGMQISPLGQHRQLQRIEATLATVQAQLATLLRALADEDEPAPGRTLDGDLFSTAERDTSQPL
jgi:hypothetical protein